MIQHDSPRHKLGFRARGEPDVGHARRRQCERDSAEGAEARTERRRQRNTTDAVLGLEAIKGVRCQAARGGQATGQAPAGTADVEFRKLVVLSKAWSVTVVGTREPRRSPVVRIADAAHAANLSPSILLTTVTFPNFCYSNVISVLQKCHLL